MSKISEALNNIAVYSAIHNHLLDRSVKKIKEELDKPQELYNKIKEKRDNAKLDYNYHCFKDKELKGQISAYNDVLSLMESMFEVKE